MLLKGTTLTKQLANNTSLFRQRMNEAGFTVLVSQILFYFIWKEPPNLKEEIFAQYNFAIQRKKIANFAVI